MIAKLQWVVLALFWVALALDLVAWGGLAESPEVGPAALQSARKEAPLALLYMRVGGALVSATGLSEWSRGVAASQFGRAYPELQSRPEAAMDLLSSSMAAPISFAHTGAPALLVLWGALWLVRPRQISTIRRR